MRKKIAYFLKSIMKLIGLLYFLGHITFRDMKEHPREKLYGTIADAMINILETQVILEHSSLEKPS